MEREYVSVPKMYDIKFIRKELGSNIKSTSIGSYESCCVTQIEVREAIQKLKSDKFDRNVYLFSKHIKLCTDTFQIHLAILLTTMMVHVHGYTPDHVLLSTISSIQKHERVIFGF